MRIPTAVKLHKASRILALEYGPDERHELTAEFLRVHSPSAEVQGHGRPVLQTGKQNVSLDRIEPAGQYAPKLTFSDGHDTGLYSWDCLDHLARNHEQLWADYLEALSRAGKSRDPDVSAVRLMP